MSPDVQCKSAHNMDDRNNFLEHPNLSDPISDSSLYNGGMDKNHLFETCYFKDLDEVRHIVECGNVDVNRAALYHFWGGVIEGASPLFAAATRGKDDIVYYLVEKGANVSARTTTSSDEKYEGISILHAAAADFFCDSCHHPTPSCRHKPGIIRCLVERGADVSSVSAKGYPSWFYARSEVNATITLIRLGMDLSLRCPTNNTTILQHWAASSVPNSLRVVKLLVKKGVQLDERDRNGLTPLALAAIAPRKRRPNLSVLEYLLNQDAFSIEDKIAALELAGSVFLGEDEGPQSRKLGFSLWRRSLKLRDMHGIVKTADTLSTTNAEFTTLADLEEMQNNPVGVKMQSFLLRQRILSRMSPSAVLKYQMKLLKSYEWNVYQWQNASDPLLRRDDCYDVTPCQKEISELLEISYILLNSEIINLRDEKSWIAIIRIVRNIIDSLKLLTSYGLTDETACPFLEKQNLLKMLQSVLDVDRHHLPDTSRLSWITNILELISVMATFLPKDDVEMLLCLRLLVDRDREANERQVLHYACDMEDSFSFPIVRLFLLAGADPNAKDSGGNTPLHLIANKIQRQDNYNEARTAELLLIFGANLYAASNGEQITLLSLLEKAAEKHGKECDWGKYKVLPLTHLSANVIRPILIKFRAEELRHCLLRSLIFVH